MASSSFEANVAAADALTLLLHNQHAICTAIEEATKWLSENGAGNSAVNAVTAMETLDKNAQGITEDFTGYANHRLSTHTEHHHQQLYWRSRILLLAFKH